MIQSLFLHYGPGGNSHVEKKIFTDELPSTMFWDQPKVKTSESPFNELVLQSEIKARSLNAKQVIGHSFGCDIAAKLITISPSQIDKIVLISPLRSIPSAMINLAKNLLKLEDETELSKEFRAAEIEKDNMDPATFWGLITAIVSHPGYKNIFWNQKQVQDEHERLSKFAPEFDAAEWQTVINHYLFVEPEILYAKLKNKNVLVILGQQDPYLDLEKDLEYWEQLVGKNNFKVIANAGHWPHLEQISEFKTFLSEKT